MGSKTNVCIFPATNKRHLTGDDLNKAKKRKPYRETESLQIAAKNNVTRTNYVKTIKDKAQQYSKFSL